MSEADVSDSIEDGLVDLAWVLAGFLGGRAGLGRGGEERRSRSMVGRMWVEVGQGASLVGGRPALVRGCARV